MEVSAAAAVTVVALSQSGSPLWGFAMWSMSYPVTAGAPDGTAGLAQATVNPAPVGDDVATPVTLSGTSWGVAVSPVGDQAPEPLVFLARTRTT